VSNKRERKALKKIIFVIGLLVSFLIAVDSVASNIEHVNIGRIAVNDQSQRSQQQAGKRALAQVFIKISGDPQVLNATEISRAVDNYEQFLIASSFLQEQQSLIFEARFNQQKVEQLLMASGLSVWTSLRPSAVLWLAREDEQQQKILVSQNQSLELGQLVKQRGFVRGVEVIVPVGDLDDAMNVSIYDVWNQFVSRLVTQSARYNTDYVISATMQGFTREEHDANLRRLEQTQPNWLANGNLNPGQNENQTNSQVLMLEGARNNDNDVLSDISANNTNEIEQNVTDAFTTELPLPDADTEDRDVAPKEIIVPDDTTHKLDYAITNRQRVFTGRLYGTSEDDLVIQLVDEYANLLAQEFSLRGSNEQGTATQSASIQLVVSNINSLADYVDLIALVESIPAVSSAKLIKQSNTTAFIKVEQALGQRQLAAILALDKRMQVNLSQQQQSDLYFNWQD
jgi:hypothetical protein